MNLVSYEFVSCQASNKGVLILSEFAADEREKRHQHNFKYVTTHTSQEWAATFVSELNDTIVEAQLRTRQVPPLLPTEVAVDRYMKSSNRLLILGFNSTLTEPVDALGRNGQLKEMELKLHPDIKAPLKKLCDDPKTTIVVLSGSDRTVLDDNFGEYNMWLAAEHGMFLRHTKGEWMTTMPENLAWTGLTVLSMFSSILLKEHLDLILNFVKLHLYGTTNMQMLSLEGFKQGICCSICGRVQSPMHLLMLSKVGRSVRSEISEIFDV
ncbi:hypothetical protein SLA2020_276920 [Shorea laevis]